MRATEIIRSLLDLIDSLDTARDSKNSGNLSLGDDVERMTRYQQIEDLLPNITDMLNPVRNRPSPKVADIEAVTTQSGTDLNKSKNPSDIRGEHVSMYPQYQYNPDKE